MPRQFDRGIDDSTAKHGAWPWQRKSTRSGDHESLSTRRPGVCDHSRSCNRTSQAGSDLFDKISMSVLSGHAALQQQLRGLAASGAVDRRRSRLQVGIEAAPRVMRPIWASCRFSLAMPVVTATPKRPNGQSTRSLLPATQSLQKPRRFALSGSVRKRRSCRGGYRTAVGRSFILNRAPSSGAACTPHR